MKILYITNGINGSGGLERVLAIKASFLAEELGHDVTILSLNQSNLDPFYNFSEKISFRSFPSLGGQIKYAVQYIKGIRKAVNQVKPDVIAVCDDGFKGFLIPRILGNRVPIIYERHASIQLNFPISMNLGFLSKKRNQLICNLMQYLARSFDAFVVLTEGNKKEWKLKDLTVIPNPLSFYSLKKASLIDKKVIAVGSHNYNKGYDLLLKAWKVIYKKNQNWSLHIFGKIDLNRTFLKLAEELGISESVVFTEPVQDIEQEYLKSSIMVLPSRSEGFGMVLIEAMACGLPCVAFDCPHGPGDIITHEEDGLLVSNGDIEELSKSLLKLMEDHSMRLKLGEHAKTNAKRYLPGVIMPKWETLFNDLVR